MTNIEKKLLDYFKGDTLAVNVWKNKYKYEKEETPDDMHRRMAKELFKIEKKYQKNPTTIFKKYLSKYGKSRKQLDEEDIYNYFKDFKYIVPQGSIMSSLGTNNITSLSNCFVIGQPEDSYGGILKKDEEMAQLMKRRGGVGLDISTLRPKNTIVNNSAKTSSGAVSFMERYSNTTREVSQNGRRGALMLSIDISHPDILDFIIAKRNNDKITGANISIRISDDFMRRVEKDEEFILKFPVDVDINVYDMKEVVKYREEVGELIIKKVKARDLWKHIIFSAWKYAEPGILFMDRHIDFSPDGVYSQYKGITTNPCGEIFMQSYDACRLIAVNLFSFVENPFSENAKVNFVKLYETFYETLVISDNIIDAEINFINRIIEKVKKDKQEDNIVELNLWEKIKETALNSRRTGVGFTGLGDMLAALGVKYGSSESLDLIEKIFTEKTKGELDATIDLAILRGTFEGWNAKLEKAESSNSYYKFIKLKFPEQYKRMQKWGRRNVSFSTVAPTGSVSILTQTTSGIEPLFKPYYIRRKKINSSEDGAKIDFVDQNQDSWEEYPVIHPKFFEWIKTKLSSKFEESALEYELKYLDTEKIEKLFKESSWNNARAEDIHFMDRIKIQKTIQDFITHSISSTINLPKNTTFKEIEKLYLEAWKQGIKGITVYVDGSRSGVLVSNNQNIEEFTYVDAKKRPKELDAIVYLIESKESKFNVFVGLLDNKPYEIFIGDKTEIKNNTLGKIYKKKKGSYIYYIPGLTHKKDGINISTNMNDSYKAITRLVSTSLRHKADIKFIVEQLNKSEGELFSFTKILARVLKNFIPNGSKSTITCDSCSSSNVMYEEGCSKCLDCGHSKCG